MRIVVGILFILAVLCPVFVSAHTPLVIEDEKNSFHLSGHLDFFEDKSGSLSINDAMEFAKDGKFTAPDAAVPNFGFTDSVYWLRFKMINPSHKEQTVFLEQGYPHIDYIELFVFNQDKKAAFFKGGDALPFSDREISFRNPVFRIQLSSRSTSQVFMRYKTESSMQMPLTGLLF
jgi:hypothetical protein